LIHLAAFLRRQMLSSCYVVGVSRLLSRKFLNTPSGFFTARKDRVVLAL
jgi:hypothetical protein